MGRKEVPPPPEPGRSLCVTSHPDILSVDLCPLPGGLSPETQTLRSLVDQRRTKTKFMGHRSGRRTFLSLESMEPNKWEISSGAMGMNYIHHTWN